MINEQIEIVQEDKKNKLLMMKTYIEKVEKERKRKEEERRKRKGWLCNAYGCIHPGGPCGCADPSQGGHWVT